MRVRMAFLCDFAQESGGKLSSIGIGIDTFHIPDLSFRLPPFSVVVKLEGNRSEAGLKKVSLHLMDMDGEEVVQPFVGQIQIMAPPVGTKIGANIIVGYGGIQYKKFGEYQLSIVVDGTELDNLPFSVVQIQNPSQPSPSEGKELN